jgi:hypothetical protein
VQQLRLRRGQAPEKKQAFRQDGLAGQERRLERLELLARPGVVLFGPYPG